VEVDRSEGIIRVLDPVTADKIAAGEVIERPMSVVKELIENALDAAATEITIELQEGGKRLVRVTDNGIGMSPSDAVLCLQRHATSKIKSADDLFSIRTLGFRGEALPSMASVSYTEIITRRPQDEFGTKVICAGGTIKEVHEVGAPPGTSVTVRDLFFNLPARKKFLRTAQTELGHITEVVNRFAISHPEVDTTLMHNDRVIFRCPKTDRLTDVVLTVFGRDAAEQSLHMSGSSGPYSIYGLVSKPTYTKANRSAQLFYVNRRFVRNRHFFHAIDEAYRGMLAQGRFPMVICFVDVDPRLVDVNVHPTKMEVKFAQEWEVHNLILSVIKEALASSPVAGGGRNIVAGVVGNIERPNFAVSAPTTGSRRPARTDFEEFHAALAQKMRYGSETEISASAPEAVIIQTEQPGELSDILAEAQVLGQVRNTYIVLQCTQGILIIDQHVAHERIVYDELASVDRKVHVQRLAIPLTLDLPKREALVVEHKVEDLKALGFDIEPFGKDTFVIRSVPALIAGKNYEQVLRDLIEELTELTVSRRLLVHREALITATACKMAIKAGDRLSTEEMVKLVSDLRRTSNPYLCPHGRPIIVCLSNRDIDKMFGRT